jgi:hypothetical protein
MASTASALAKEVAEPTAEEIAERLKDVLDVGVMARLAVERS